MIKTILRLAALCLALSALPAHAQLVFGANKTTTPIAPTIQASAYASGNAIGGLITVPIGRAQGFPGAILDQVMVEWHGGETVGTVAYIFRHYPSSATTCNDKSAFVLANADAVNLVEPPFTLTPVASTGSTQTYAAQNVAVSVQNGDVPPQPVLYLCLVVDGAVTPAVGDLNVILSAAQD